MSKTKDSSAEKSSGMSRRIGHAALRTADVTISAAASTVSGIFRVLGTVLLIFLISGLLFTCIFAYYVKTCLTPDLQISLSDYKLSESSTIYYQDSSGSWRELCLLTSRQNRVWADYDEIPQYMKDAIVAIEDKRFYEHKGVDWYRTSGAFITMFATMQNDYGGSTITQQLIKNLTGQDEVTVMRKLTEIFSALELEKRYTKEEILEWYMNAVYFGEGSYGVETAAQTYFGKSVSELDLAECAAIAGITNLPTYYDPFYNEQNNKNRQETILREMYEQGYISYAEYTEAVNEELVFIHSADSGDNGHIYSYFEEVVIADVISDLMEEYGIGRNTATTLLYNGGYRIYCTLDTRIQSIVDAVYLQEQNYPRQWASATKPLQSGIVIMDPYNGNIVALSGGVGEKDSNFPLNRATGTLRPAGSSIKPLASYGPALELGLITANTMVYDSPSIRLSGTSWYPRNDGGDYYGTVTIAKALQNSLNTVAAQIVDKLTPQVCYNWLTTKLGFTSLVPDDASYAPMALGQFTNGVTVREMAQGYTALVNDGVFTESRTYTLVTDSAGNTILDNQPESITAFSANTAHVLTYMLQNAVTRGTGTQAYFSSTAVAGKTGTTTNYQDRWFVGYTSYYIAAVWTGYDQPEYIRASGNPAAAIFKTIMSKVHYGLSYQSFTYPYLGEDTGIFNVVVEEEEDNTIIVEGIDTPAAAEAAGFETLPEADTGGSFG